MPAPSLFSIKRVHAVRLESAIFQAMLGPAPRGVLPIAAAIRHGALHGNDRALLLGSVMVAPGSVKVTLQHRARVRQPLLLKARTLLFSGSWLLRLALHRGGILPPFAVSAIAQNGEPGDIDATAPFSLRNAVMTTFQWSRAWCPPVLRPAAFYPHRTRAPTS